jgi:beta-lactamase class A
MKNAHFKIVFLILSLLFPDLDTFAQIETLRQKLQNIATASDGKLGIGIIDLVGKDSLTIHGKAHFVMQSVYKFHLGLAVLNQVDRGKLRLDQKILVKKKDLLPNTWSPLREKYPNGEVELPLSEILEYTIASSDNNGCDILFRLVGGPKTVDKYIKSIGIKDVNIVATEEEMHADEKVQYTNWSTPWSATLLLQKLAQKKHLSSDTWAFMWKTMVGTTTGPNKLKGLLPAGTIVAHKTGFSDTNSKGIIDATNDIGIITLPNGKQFAIAVFYGQTKMTEKECDRVIAEVAKAAWDYFVVR